MARLNWTDESRRWLADIYGHYRITYFIRPDGDIDILGVFHGALDIGRYEL